MTEAWLSDFMIFQVSTWGDLIITHENIRHVMSDDDLSLGIASWTMQEIV